MARLTLAMVAAEDEVVAETMGLTVVLVTQVQTGTLALKVVMEAGITMVALERLAMLVLTEAKGQTAQALQQETQAILGTQAALETTEQVLQAVVLGARLRLLGLAKQALQVQQVRQGLRLPMQTKS